MGMRQRSVPLTFVHVLHISYLLLGQQISDEQNSCQTPPIRKERIKICLDRMCLSSLGFEPGICTLLVRLAPARDA